MPDLTGEGGPDEMSAVRDGFRQCESRGQRNEELLRGVAVCQKVEQ